jgi:hypothetical protein
MSVLEAQAITAKHEIRVSVKKLSRFYGGKDTEADNEFLKNYLDDILQHKDIFKVLEATRDLVKHMERMQKYGYKRGDLAWDEQKIQDEISGFTEGTI